MGKEEFRKKLAERQNKRRAAEVQPESRYDDVFYEGLRALDQIDLEPEVGRFINENFWDLI